MSIILKSEFQSNETLYSLFKSYIEAGLTSGSSEEAIIGAAKKFLKKMKTGKREAFISADLALHPGIFEITGKENQDVTASDIYFGLNAYAKEIYSLITGEDNKSVNIEGVERKKLPDISAFAFIGNNAPKESRRLANYSLVYGS